MEDSKERLPLIEQKKILFILDDDTLNRRAYASSLAKSVYNVKIIEFSSAMELLKYIRANAMQAEQLPDFIIITLEIPIVDGFAFVKEYEKLCAQIEKESVIAVRAKLITKGKYAALMEAKPVVAVLSYAQPAEDALKALYAASAIV